MNQVLQRYLLVAQVANQSILASATTAVTATTANVPLGSHWTIRMRSATIFVTAGDTSGELQVFALQSIWNLLNSAGTILFTIGATYEGIVTPATKLLTLTPVQRMGDPNQIVSSLDQIGGIVTQVQAQAQVQVTNLDATNPHPLTLTVEAVLEFETPGSS